MGISYFILDTKSPGLTIRPITQITGETEFYELFLDNAEIPAGNLIGTENEGWRVAQLTWSAERGLIVFGLCERLSYAFKSDLEDGRQTWFKDDQFRREYGMLYAELRGVRLLIRKMLRQGEDSAEMAGPALPSFIKLRWAQLLFNYGDFLMRAGECKPRQTSSPFQVAA